MFPHGRSVSNNNNLVGGGGGGAEVLQPAAS